MSNGEWIREATEATFEQEVIERSRQAPVLVDFWASWCAPCGVLGPLLEAAVTARGGAVWLVKIDTEESPGLAAQYGVQGIPVVKAFVDGEVRTEFVGARDRGSIDAFIDDLIPSPVEEALMQAERLLGAGNPGEVSAVLEPALASPNDRDRALILLARAAAARGDVEAAEASLDEIAEESPERARADGLKLKIDLMTSPIQGDTEELRARREASPDDLDVRWGLAGKLLADDAVREALTELLEILKRSRKFKDDAARRAMLAIFEEIGINHELANEFRRQMQIYL